MLERICWLQRHSLGFPSRFHLVHFEPSAKLDVLDHSSVASIYKDAAVLQAMSEGVYAECRAGCGVCV